MFQVVQYKGSNISQHIDQEGRVWFLAADVCKYFGFTVQNASKFLERHLNHDFKRQISKGVGRPAWYISEPGIYQLGFQAGTDEAIAFQRWVFEEVLPSIRKSGFYATEEVQQKIKDLLQSLLNIERTFVDYSKQLHLAAKSAEASNFQPLITLLRSQGNNFQDIIKADSSLATHLVELSILLEVPLDAEFRQ